MKIGELLFRDRRPKDDTFITDITLHAMKDIFFQSTGVRLTKGMIQQQISASQNVMILESATQNPIGYYNYAIFKNGHMYLGSLMLLPSVRAKGVGSKVVQHIEQEAIKEGISVLDGHVQVTNKKALSFWQKAGFQITGPPIQGSIPIRKILPSRFHSLM